MANASADAGRLIQISLLGEAIEQMPVAVFVFDDEGRYVAVNAHATRLLGYSRDELLGMRLGELAVSPGDAYDAYRELADGARDEAETRVRRKDGREIALRFRGGETMIARMPFYAGVAWQVE